MRKAVISWKLGLAALAATLVVPAYGAATGTEGEAPGKALYIKFGCYGCHGTVGQGATTGARLTPALPLPAFEAIVRRPPNVMPAYPQALLSDAQVAQIHAYLAALPPPPDPRSLPGLSGD